MLKRSREQIWPGIFCANFGPGHTVLGRYHKITDEAAVKRTLTLQPEQLLAASRDASSGMAASSYSAHFLDGAAFQASGLSSLLLLFLKSKSRTELEAHLQLALSSVKDARSFQSYGQSKDLDTLGALMATNVNLTLASGDRILARLRPYLAPRHPAHSALLRLYVWTPMSAIQEVIVASCEDTTQEWTCQDANLVLTQNRRPSSQAPCGEGVGRKATWRHTGTCSPFSVSRSSAQREFCRHQGIPAGLEAVSVGTDAPITAADADVGASSGTLRPDDSSTEVGPSLYGSTPGPAPLRRSVVRGSGSSGGGGGEAHFVPTSLARHDVRSVDLRRNSAAHVEGVAPPREGVPYNIDDTATGGRLSSGEAGNRASDPTRILGILFPCFLAHKKNGQLRPVVNLRRWIESPLPSRLKSWQGQIRGHLNSIIVACCDKTF